MATIFRTGQNQNAVITIGGDAMGTDDDKNNVLAVFPYAYIIFSEGAYRVLPKPEIAVDIGSGKNERLAWHDAALNL